MAPMNTHKDTTTHHYANANLYVNFCSPSMMLPRVKVKIKVTFTSAGSKSNADVILLPPPGVKV